MTEEEASLIVKKINIVPFFPFSSKSVHKYFFL